MPGLAFSFPTATVVTTVDGTQPTNQVDLGTNSLELATPWQPGGALWLIWAIDYYGSGSGNGYAIDNLQFFASANPIVIGSAPVLGSSSFSESSGSSFSFSFTNTPGASFTVYTTTNLTPPVNWVQLGQPVETPKGAFSTYTFKDTQTSGKARRFYQVLSP
jgi:hypothetical protein